MRKLYRLFSLSTALLLMIASAALAQQRVVTGLVKDENGNGMPGVNVLIKGTAQGTTTDTDGKFTIELHDDATLVFTFVGYESAEIAVGNKTTLEVMLDPDLTTLSEVVVTGYTSQRKRDITGAVSVVTRLSLPRYTPWMLQR